MFISIELKQPMYQFYLGFAEVTQIIVVFPKQINFSISNSITLSYSLVKPSTDLLATLTNKLIFVHFSEI